MQVISWCATYQHAYKLIFNVKCNSRTKGNFDYATWELLTHDEGSNTRHFLFILNMPASMNRYSWYISYIYIYLVHLNVYLEKIQLWNADLDIHKEAGKGTNCLQGIHNIIYITQTSPTRWVLRTCNSRQVRNAASFH